MIDAGLSKNLPHLAQYHYLDYHLVNPRLDEVVSQVAVLASGSTLAWHLEEPALPVKARKLLLPSEAGEGEQWELVEESEIEEGEKVLHCPQV
jgi:hypothetical protein